MLPRPLLRLLILAVAAAGAGCPEALPQIASVAVSPASPAVVQGSSVQLTATATLSDSTTRDVTAEVAWSSGNGDVAAVDPGGLVVAVAPGQAVITATASNGQVGSSTVTVTATPVSLAVTPRTPQTPLGVPVQLTATATLSDSTTRDVTAEVTWSAAPAGVVSVSGAGQATPLAEGSATVSASLGGLGSDDTGESATLTVLPAALVQITVSPASPSIPKGTTRSLAAEGRYTDDSTQDLTGSVTWSSDDEASATVSGGGLVTAVEVGDAVITATHPSSGASGQATVTVTAPALVSLSISPAAPTVQVGASLQLSAEGTFTDGSQQDRTALVLWAAGNGNATVSASGLLAGAAPGTVAITATDAASGVSDSVTATVVDQVSAPAFSPAGGSYSQQQTVTITSDATAAIWYTSDGSQPSCGGGTQYAAPILVQRGVTLRAIACEGGRADSPVTSATYAITRWLAVSRFGVAVRSTDRGVTWTAAATGVGTALYDAAYGNGRWVVAGDSGALRYSDDGGVTWSAATHAATTNFRGVAFGEGRWVAVGTGGAVLYSDDGASWTAGTGGTAGDWASVAYGNGRFVAVGNGATYSDDGAAWTLATGAPGNGRGVGTDGAGTFVVSRDSGNTVYRSANNGANWSVLPIVLPTGFFYGVAYDAGRWLIGADGRLWHTTDLNSLSWNYISYASTLRDVAVDGMNGRVAVGYDNNTGASDILYSTNAGSPSFTFSSTPGTTAALYGMGVGQ